MASNVEALRAELDAALALLMPQIRGLHDLAAVSISSDLLAQINDQITVRERRRDLIIATIDALDALEGDGYPELAPAVLPVGLFGELQGEETDLDAAVAIFEKAGPATQIDVVLGAPTDKP